MNRCKLVAISILIATASAAIADTNQPPPTNGFTLSLQYGKETALSAHALQTLYPKAVELLESSIFNSGASRWNWNVSKIIEGYRKTVSGKYFLVSFKEPRKITTVGGEVSVREIVIGLNRPDYASSLYTIGDGGG